MALENDLKQAIVAMPTTEKDKLLLRLIAKDDNLVKQLEFKLLEASATLDSRRDQIKKSILKVAKMEHYSPGYMMMDMRYLSGDISQHVKITKDKYGDIELNLYLLNTFFRHQLDHLRVHTSKSDTCAEYFAKKASTILKNLAKFDEDYYVDFESEITFLLEHLHDYCPKNYARALNIPKHWP